MMFIFVCLLSTTICRGAYPLDLQASYSKCVLYYDFARGSSNRISSSPFTQNAFVGQIISNSYFDIIDETTIIASNSVSSYSQYTVIFDVEFPEIAASGTTYFWGADSIATLNTGGWNGKQYHFTLTNTKPGIENNLYGPGEFTNSPVLTINQRYLFVYVVRSTDVDLYINGIFINTISLSNGGVYQPYYIKIGGVGHAQRPYQKMKLYQYAFYAQTLTASEINQLASSTTTTTAPPTTTIPTTSIPTTTIPTISPTSTTSTASDSTTTIATTSDLTTSKTLSVATSISVTSIPTIKPSNVPSSAPSIQVYDGEISLPLTTDSSGSIQLKNNSHDNSNNESTLELSNIYVLIILLSITCFIFCCVIFFGLYLIRKKKAPNVSKKGTHVTDVSTCTTTTINTSPNRNGIRSNSQISNGSLSILNTEPMSPNTLTNNTFGESPLNTSKMTNMNMNVMTMNNNINITSPVVLNIGPHAQRLELEKVKSVSINNNCKNDCSSDSSENESDDFNDNAYTKGIGNDTIR